MLPVGECRPGSLAENASLNPMIIEFDADVFRWDARADTSWFFGTVPAELSEDIRELPRPPRGFGAVRVRARIGGSEWSTSIFPSAQRGGYILPPKQAVRDAEGLEEGGTAWVRREVRDV